MLLLMMPNERLIDGLSAGTAVCTKVPHWR